MNLPAAAAAAAAAAACHTLGALLVKSDMFATDDNDPVDSDPSVADPAQSPVFSLSPPRAPPEKRYPRTAQDKASGGGAVVSAAAAAAASVSASASVLTAPPPGRRGAADATRGRGC